MTRHRAPRRTPVPLVALLVAGLALYRGVTTGHLGLLVAAVALVLAALALADKEDR